MNIKSKRFIKFLFPLHPYRVFKSTKLLIIIAVLLALRIILNFISVPIPGANIVISFSWVPVMIMGWIYGPVHGLTFGFITDSVCYLISPTYLWYWMYAIQEPIVGLTSGLARSIYEIRSQDNKENIYDFFIAQIILFCFTTSSLLGILLWVNGNVLDYYNSYKYISISLSIVYFIVIECFMWIYLKKMNKNDKRYLLFLYAITLISIIIVLFSFLLGPIASIEYLKYLNGEYPANYMKYGLLIYFVPRVIVQTIKVPIESLFFCSIVLIINPILNNYIMQLDNRWK